MARENIFSVTSHGKCKIFVTILKDYVQTDINRVNSLHQMSPRYEFACRDVSSMIYPKFSEFSTFYMLSEET